MTIEKLSDEELISLYNKIQREVSELNEGERGSRGFGARIYPIMNVIPKANAKAPPAAVQTIYCPGREGQNAFSSLPSASEMINTSTVQAVAAAAGTQAATQVAQALSDFTGGSY